jgi:hypothetical protein
MPLRTPLIAAALAGLCLCAAPAAPRAKGHVVALGAGRHVPYSLRSDPAGASSDEVQLRVRPLVVDDKVKDWTTGDPHDVTDRSFVVRRALRLNDALPGDRAEHWIWQRGPWVLVDRSNGHIQPLKLPDYDPAISRVVWFRDYAAYCGLNASGKQLLAVVAQIAARKPVLAKKLGPRTVAPAATPPALATASSPACAPAVWQRDPLRITFQQSGGAASSYDLVGSSALLVEDGDTDDAPAAN